jgi:hypothetical protein
MSTPNVKEVIRQKYGQAALGVESEAGCCGDRPSVMEVSCDPITSNLYDPGRRRMNCRIRPSKPPLVAATQLLLPN